MTAYKICTKCNEEREASCFYKTGKVCFHCQKPSVFTTKKVTNNKLRTCLKCDRQFASFSGNRICSRCKKSNEDWSDLDSYSLIG